MGLFMRSLTSFLTECEQKYEFKVKIACADDMGSEEMDRLEIDYHPCQSQNGYHQQHKKMSSRVLMGVMYS